MATMKNPQGPGTFCWYELASRDPAAAKTFYHELFGWKANDLPMPDGGPGGTYTIFELEGKHVCGLFQLGPQMKNVPPHWASYVEVEDIDKTFKKAQSLGATGRTPIMDVGDMGRSVVLEDPTGAGLSLWQPLKREGNLLLDQVHGNRCWNELLTNNIDRSGKFYADLFGWRPEIMPMPNGAYTVFKRGEEQAGGMFAITKEMGSVPSSWVVYFHVDSCDRAVNLVKKQKGKVMMGPEDIPEVGRIAVVTDPQNVVLGFVQPPK
jgi:uncharacterized protein